MEMSRVGGILKLTRWREHVPFTVPLTIVGALLAASTAEVPVDFRLVAVILANILAISFAFMINDLCDAEDDARDKKKRSHNVISARIVSRSEGKSASFVVAVLALGLYALSSWWTLIWGSITLSLSYLYSSHPLRLKARPVVDIVSHVFMLGGLLVMNGYYIYHDAPGIAWAVVVSAVLFSAYGQFYNQIEDFEADKKAGLQNTSILLGKLPATMLMYASTMGALATLGVAIWNGLFPTWLGAIFMVGLIFSALYPWERDMRGNKTNGLAVLQRPSILIANLVAFAWVAQTLGWLRF